MRPLTCAVGGLLRIRVRSLNTVQWASPTRAGMESAIRRSRLHQVGESTRQTPFWDVQFFLCFRFEVSASCNLVVDLGCCQLAIVNWTSRALSGRSVSNRLVPVKLV